MSVPENALPTGGPAKPAQIAKISYETDRRDRILLVFVLLWCLLTVDVILWSWPWALGLTASVAAWYALLAAALGAKLIQSRESRCLLVMNLCLGATFALTSNSWFRVWNLLALLVLVPVHVCALSGAVLPWWRPAMLWERFLLFWNGLFSPGAALAALAPSQSGKNSKRTIAVVLGSAGALLLLAILIPVLASADALFAAATQQLRQFIRDHLTSTFWNLFCALILTPFLFGLVYFARRPRPVKQTASAKSPAMDGLVFVIILGALDVLYLLFLLVQSAGLFGGEAYLAQRGISYAEWARSGFFQMVGVTVVNLSILMAALSFSRRTGKIWWGVRVLSAVLSVQSLVLLASAFWRMSLYVSAYGLSFKRCMTYWGMAMMAIFFLAALWKIRRPDFAFCRVAFAAALAGWLIINCVPIDYLVAEDQVDRYLAGETGHADVEYLLGSLSYDALSQLDRLDSTLLVETWEGRFSLAHLRHNRRMEARQECTDWLSWNLSAFLATQKNTPDTVVSGVESSYRTQLIPIPGAAEAAAWR